MISSSGYAALDPALPLSPFTFERRDPGPHDVVIEILYCGLCHSDIHQVRNEWREGVFPMVPGHEIVGRVTATGASVTGFKPGDLAGVGCMVDSCRICPACTEHQEQFCATGATFTYGSPEKQTGGVTYGGYSNNIVADEAFILRIADSVDLAATAPLLCAGITTYSPLRHWKVGPGQKVGVIGLGGLGHMGLKFARSFGTHVVQFTTSKNKVEDALRLGAHEVVISSDPEQMAERAGTLDFILDTVSAPHDINQLLALLRRDGHMVMVGLPSEPLNTEAGRLIFGRRSLAGSLIGGIQETQEMLDYCAAHNIVADIEMIPIQKVNEAFDRTVKADVKYRFVIDMASLKP